MPCGDLYQPKLSSKRNDVNSFGAVNGIVAFVEKREHCCELLHRAGLFGFDF